MFYVVLLSGILLINYDGMLDFLPERLGNVMHHVSRHKESYM